MPCPIFASVEEIIADIYIDIRIYMPLHPQRNIQYPVFLKPSHRQIPDRQVESTVLDDEDSRRYPPSKATDTENTNSKYKQNKTQNKKLFYIRFEF